MKTVGFPISHKENENRRAMIPPDVSKISHPEALFFEHGYGNVMGFSKERIRQIENLAIQKLRKVNNIDNYKAYLEVG